MSPQHVEAALLSIDYASARKEHAALHTNGDTVHKVGSIYKIRVSAMRARLPLHPRHLHTALKFDLTSVPALATLLHRASVSSWIRPLHVISVVTLWHGPHVHICRARTHVIIVRQSTDRERAYNMLSGARHTATRNCIFRQDKCEPYRKTVSYGSRATRKRTAIARGAGIAGATWRYVSAEVACRAHATRECNIIVAQALRCVHTHFICLTHVVISSALSSLADLGGVLAVKQLECARACVKHLLQNTCQLTELLGPQL